VKRPTIEDIARRAGVSKGAVSYALNGRPGVSEATRNRVLAIAAELGWYPSSAARALSDGRAGALGLVVDRPARILGIEPFFMHLISGIEAILSARSIALLLQVTEDQQTEMEIYRRWWAQRRVDGVIVVDLQVDDPRIPLLESLGMPAIVVGGPDGLGSLPGVWSDDGAAIQSVVEYLAKLGHRRVARVAGPPTLRHTQVRTTAAQKAAQEAGIPEITTIDTDYTGEAGGRATRTLLTQQQPPTAIIYDNDVMAVAGVAVAHQMGIRIPDQLSIVAWEDSALCELVHPALTTVTRDVAEYGRHTAERLLDLIEGRTVTVEATATPRLLVRGSTSYPPH